jgi:hypothetical protein
MTLDIALTDFMTRASASRPVKSLLARWAREVEIRPAGGPPRFLRSAGGALDGPSRESSGAPDVVVEADERVLLAVFRGETSPARAHLDGDLAVYGTEKDRIVLDALVLLIWGA